MAAAVVVVGGSAVVVVHAWQVRREAASLLAEAGRAGGGRAAGRAAEYLKRYLVYAPNDVDALERYGRLLAPAGPHRRRPGTAPIRIRKDP